MPTGGLRMHDGGMIVVVRWLRMLIQRWATFEPPLLIPTAHIKR